MSVVGQTPITVVIVDAGERKLRIEEIEEALLAALPGVSISDVALAEGVDYVRGHVSRDDEIGQALLAAHTLACEVKVEPPQLRWVFCATNRQLAPAPLVQKAQTQYRRQQRKVDARGCR